MCNQFTLRQKFRIDSGRTKFKQGKTDGAQVDGVPKTCRQQAAADPQRVPNLRVCKHRPAWVTQGMKDELTSCRGTVQQKPPVRRKGGRAGLPKNCKWPPRGTWTTVFTFAGSAPRDQARLVKTVNIQVRWAAAHLGQDRRLSSVVTHSRLQRATSVRSMVGIVLEDGSRVVIGWVTGRSCSSARTRLNVQSAQREGRKGAAAPYPSVAVRDRGH